MSVWMIVVLICAVLTSFTLGYFLSTMLIAKDPDLVKLDPDMIVVKRPADGLVLVAVTPEIMRRLIMNPEEYPSTEARSLRSLSQ